MTKLYIVAQFNAQYFILKCNFHQIQPNYIKSLIQFLNYENWPRIKQMHATSFHHGVK